MRKQKNKLSFQEVHSKLMRYCAYQERSEREVLEKLKEFELGEEEKENIINSLLEEGFVNNERFAIGFAHGKMKVKRWGSYKIREGLLKKGIQTSLIEKAIATIDSYKYRENLVILLEKKRNELDGNKDISAKVYRFLLSKGYESHMILEEMRKAKLMQ